MEIRCSVCMATYNGEKYLNGQVSTILQQLSANDELIISDDSSSDNTINILRSFNDERIKIYKNTKKSGPVGNFENALTKAKGDYIFLADQDDIWIEGKIKKHIALHNGGYDLVISDAFVVSENGKNIHSSFFKERGSKPGLINNLLRNSYIGCCMSFKRCILDIALPFPTNIHMHDWWIGIVSEYFGSVYFCDEKFLKYMRHENNASMTLIQTLPFLQQIRNRSNLLYNILKVLIKKHN